MSTRISIRRLGRATLARQHLLERVRMGALEMVEHLVGLQSQEPLSAYGGLWTRLHGFEAAELADLLENRRVVRILAMRGTIHLFSARDCLGLRPVMQPVLDRVYTAARIRAVIGDPAELERRARELPAAGPMLPMELNRALAPHCPDATLDDLAGRGWSVAAGAGAAARGVGARRAHDLRAEIHRAGAFVTGGDVLAEYRKVST
ncbi:DNA glycosylase AlkZ-like family protein [Kineosporia succinea]|uniref:Winged helix DNA-binding protein n=1 Tax=Kineosporia succinea TaxID=84632 RepID=A0ABT9P675_9ACTN|nr:crosslink repair DNA glycosylase YcaQ family protein [Kineosporia succinea]MDP9828187.1 hypothetical protein [Kineosporia succinea]